MRKSTGHAVVHGVPWTIWVIFVGNDMYRDVLGAQRLGMRTLFFESNQGNHTHEGVRPDYVVTGFERVPEGLAFLSTRDEPEDL